MKKHTAFLAIMMLFTCIEAQTPGMPDGTMASVKNTKFQRTERVENGSHALGVFYNKSATGLNYVIASVLTTTRPTWQPGSGFPASTITPYITLKIYSSSFISYH